MTTPVSPAASASAAPAPRCDRVTLVRSRDELAAALAVDEGADRADRADSVGGADRVGGGDKTDRAGSVGGADRVGRADKTDRADRVNGGDRADGAAKPEALAPLVMPAVSPVQVPVPVPVESRAPSS